MPAISPNEVVRKVLGAIQQSGGVAAYVSESPRVHPRKFLVSYLGDTYSLWVYIWTLTHGGRVSLPDEYRIQMTSVESPLKMNPDGSTILLGYHPNLNVFAGFDIQKHRVFTTGSPSVQINISALNAALQSGLSFVTKSNDEIAVGVRPDQFLIYSINAKVLHEYGAEARMIKLLQKAAESVQINRSEIDGLTANRRKVIEIVSKFSRNANFSRTVLNAYDNRCAVTRWQLRLLDAAHILPVPSSKSSDHVTNGMALSPTFHRAYDNCLIYLDENYRMQLNDEKAEELKNSNLYSGLVELKSFLNKTIHLPNDIRQRPSPKFIKLANKHRRIPGY